MVLVKQIHYQSKKQKIDLTNSSSSVMLLIQRIEKKKNQEPSVLFFLQSTLCEPVFDEEAVLGERFNVFLNSQYGLEFVCSCALPLKSTKSLDQLWSLLFSYYQTKEFDYSMTEALEFLVGIVFKMNAEILNGKHPFLSILFFMYEQRYEKLTLKKICSSLYISESSLKRQCKKFANETPLNIFRKMKCEEARKLLIETTLSIEEISEKLHYSSIQHFSMAFKKVEGQTPRQVRAENENRKRSMSR